MKLTSMTKLGNAADAKAGLPLQDASADDLETARIKAVALTRQAAEMANQVGCDIDASKLMKIADRIERHKPRRKRQQTGSPGDRALTDARKRGVVTFTI